MRISVLLDYGSKISIIIFAIIMLYRGLHTQYVVVYDPYLFAKLQQCYSLKNQILMEQDYCVEQILNKLNGTGYEIINGSIIAYSNCNQNKYYFANP